MNSARVASKARKEPSNEEVNIRSRSSRRRSEPLPLNDNRHSCCGREEEGIRLLDYRGVMRFLRNTAPMFIVLAVSLPIYVVVHRLIHTNTSTFATIVLVGITVYYAWQNRTMAIEMRKARELTVLPHIALDLHSIGPVNIDVVIRNAGQGPALNLDAILRFHLREGQEAEAGAVLERRVQLGYLAPAQMKEFLPPANAQGGWSFPALAALLEAVTLDGTVQSALNQTHPVTLRIDDLSEKQRRLVEAQRRYQAPVLDRIHAELEKTRHALERLARAR